MMRPLLLERVRRRFAKPLAFLVFLHLVGALAYRIIGGDKYTLFDGLYMAFITIATIGYAETVDLTHSPAGRAFTMLFGFVGIATTWYIFSQLTAFIVEGEVNFALRRRRMLKAIERMSGHYIVCGVGRVGSNVARELISTDRAFVIVDSNQAHIDAFRERHAETVFLHGDPAEDALLRDAGVERGTGVFAVVGDDRRNLVITLSAKSVNPKVRVVARCHDIAWMDKMKKVGADAIVSPDFTGGMRIAPAMIRPTVVTFLDEMLRSDKALRVEEIPVGARHAGRNLGMIERRGPDHIVLALRRAVDFQPGTRLSAEWRRDGRRGCDAAGTERARGTLRVAKRRPLRPARAGRRRAAIPGPPAPRAPGRA
jgi:voltage-gated potassium channel